MSSIDEGAGTSFIHYRIDAGSFVRYSDNFTLSGVGEYAITYYAEDNLGNRESARTYDVFVDDDPPVVTMSPGNISAGNIEMKNGGNITFNHTDKCPGEVMIYYRLGIERNWSRYVRPVKIECNTSVEYYAVDALGNRGSDRKINITVVYGKNDTKEDDDDNDDNETENGDDDDDVEDPLSEPKKKSLFLVLLIIGIVLKIAVTTAIIIVRRRSRARRKTDQELAEPEKEQQNTVMSEVGDDVCDPTDMSLSENDEGEIITEDETEASDPAGDAITPVVAPPSESDELSDEISGEIESLSEDEANSRIEKEGMEHLSGTGDIPTNEDPIGKETTEEGTRTNMQH